MALFGGFLDTTGKRPHGRQRNLWRDCAPSLAMQRLGGSPGGVGEGCLNFSHRTVASMTQWWQEVEDGDGRGFLVWTFEICGEMV